MGAATVLPVAVVEGKEPGVGRRTRRELEARRADAARRKGGPSVGRSPSLLAGDGRLRLVPRFELTGEALVANDDLVSLRRSRSAAPGRTARPAGPAAAALAVRPAVPASFCAPLSGQSRDKRSQNDSVAKPAPSRASAATYRRRRLVVGALVLGVLLAGGWALGALGGGPLTASEARSRDTMSIESAVPVSQTTYVVQPGDTLWSIGRQVVAPGADVRPIVDALAAERNGRPLEVGETIVLP